MKYEYVCSNCGSDRVVADAWAEWDGSEWVVESIFDEQQCNACDAHGKTVMVKTERSAAK